MAPKKAAAEAQPSEVVPAEEKTKKPDATTVRKLATHPTTAVMVKEAIKELDSRKGVSSQAIQNYIKLKYPSVDLVRLKSLVRKALKKGLENGTLVRPANSTEARGTLGRFRLAEKEPKVKSENVDPNTQKAFKAEKDGAKEPKKRKPAATKKVEKDELSEEPKPAKKTKKAEDVSKAASVKPKATKKAASSEKAEGSETQKPKGKAKVSKGDKGEKAGKAPKAKGTTQTGKSEEAPTKAPGKRGKNAE